MSKKTQPKTRQGHELPPARTDGPSDEARVQAWRVIIRIVKRLIAEGKIDPATLTEEGAA